jgi:citrate lyase subunit beta/citryl-CoA lyase
MATRTFLWVPADRPEMLAKAPGRGADVLFVDLEDGVTWEMKEQARSILGDWLASGDRPDAVWVRVNNHSDLIDDDLRVAIDGRVQGVILPKVDGPSDIERVGSLLGRFDGGAEAMLIPIIETAAAVQAAASIAAGRRVVRLAMGEADLAADLGILTSEDDSMLLPARMAVVTASAAAGIEPPVGPVHTDVRNLEALRQSSVRLKRMGFCGRQVIHPAQIEVAREVFTPTPDEVDEAAELLALAEEAREAGRGAFVDSRGRMVDEAILRTARRTLAAASDDL